MVKPVPTRPVQCYHCRHRFDVAAAARTSSCPKCSKHLQLDDVIISDYHAVRRIQTCGRVVVTKKGRIVAQLIEASAGFEIHGAIEAKVVTSGAVYIGPKGQLKGDCAAASLAVELGALLGPGQFLIPDPAILAAAPPTPATPPPAPSRTAPPPKPVLGFPSSHGVIGTPPAPISRRP